MSVGNSIFEGKPTLNFSKLSTVVPFICSSVHVKLEWDLHPADPSHLQAPQVFKGNPHSMRARTGYPQAEYMPWLLVALKTDYV